MSKRLIPLAAAAAMAAGAPPAQAAGWVYGGSTSDGEPIVVTAAAAKKLTSTVLSWTAVCASDGGIWSASSALTPAVNEPGFAPTLDNLVMTRNRSGRFSGSRTQRFAGGGHVSTVVETFTGRVTRTRATGTLRAMVKITDGTTGADVDSCQTGTLRWKAARAPGRIFAGSTSQDDPIVLRVDPRRRRVTDVMTAWETDACTPDADYRYSERFINFSVSRSGAFGNPFMYDVAFNDGVHRHFAYDFRGRLTAHAAHGTLRVGMTDADATGAQISSCDTGGITWKAVTG